MSLSRSTLYSWAWRLPLVELAEALNTTPSELARTCKRSDIPVPPRGHWRRVETGNSTSAIPLPHPEVETELAYQVNDAELELREIALVDRQAGRAGRLKGRASEDEVSLSAKEANVAYALSISSAPPDTPLALERGEDSPDADSLVAFLLKQSERHDSFLAMESLLDCLERLDMSRDPPTNAVLTLLLTRAREVISERSAVDHVAGACRRIALGLDRPQWWLAASQRSSRRDKDVR